VRTSRAPAAPVASASVHCRHSRPRPRAHPGQTRRCRSAVRWPAIAKHPAAGRPRTLTDNLRMLARNKRVVRQTNMSLRPADQRRLLTQSHDLSGRQRTVIEKREPRCRWPDCWAISGFLGLLAPLRNARRVCTLNVSLGQSSRRGLDRRLLVSHWPGRCGPGHGRR
jgi:hypothetical protein